MGRASWLGVCSALLVAAPLALSCNHRFPIISTSVEATPSTAQPTLELARCGSVEWPSPRNCDENESSVRVITPTTTKVPTGALRAAEAKVAADVEELAKNSQSGRNEPVRAILVAKPKKTRSQEYARRARPAGHQVDTALLGYGY